jgi:TetR/AcrR family transcriptional regulator, transcriptional repressor for nem operon
MSTVEITESSALSDPGQPSLPSQVDLERPEEGKPANERGRAQTKQQLIQIGTEIIGKTGFNATGLDAVLKKAKVPKGSFYYYFQSKEDFGLAVIDSFAETAKARLDHCLNQTEGSPLSRIRGYLEGGVIAVETNGFSRGCLIGNLSQELSSQNERFRERLNEVLEYWRSQFARSLDLAKQNGEVSAEVDPNRMAGFMLAGWQGAILRAKVMKSAQPLKDFIDVFFNSVLR